ncbi:MAG: DUF4367 domain-containing protein [Tissierellaceae bacterium]
MADSTLKEAFQLSLQDELEKMIKLNINSIKYQSLSDKETFQLAIKIGLLPLEYRSILFFRYCFNNTPSETNSLLDIENSIGKLRYVQKMLSLFMGLENSFIDYSSMKKACEIALMKDTKDYNNIKLLHKPIYSKTFRQKLRDLNIKQDFNKIFLSVVKKVAIFMLIVFLSFSAVLAVNAEAREKVFDWIIERFPKFSIFISKDLENDDKSIELTSLTINYIPAGFELVDIHEGRKMLIYNYLGENDQEFYIKLLASTNKSKSYYDTENVEIEEIIFKSLQAYTWQTDKLTYLIWYQDGIEYHVIGNLNKDEILKVAENILK